MVHHRQDESEDITTMTRFDSGLPRENKFNSKKIKNMKPSEINITSIEESLKALVEEVESKGLKAEAYYSISRRLWGGVVSIYASMEIKGFYGPLAEFSTFSDSPAEDLRRQFNAFTIPSES